MWQVYGQDHITRQLETSLTEGRLAHAYLLVGPPHVGKMALAINLAQAVNCLEGAGAPCGNCAQCTRISQGIHADVRVVAVGPKEEGGPTRTVIGIDDIKEVLRQVNLKPFEGSRSVIIFNGAESMSEEAANALLKTLEEPPDQVLILLLAHDEDALLPTVRSRCRRLLLRPVAKDLVVSKLVNDYRAEPDQAENLGRMSRGCLGWAVDALANQEILEERENQVARLSEVCRAGLSDRFSYANDLASTFSRDRESARQVLYLWLRWWRDLLLVKEGADEYLHHTDWTEELRLQATQLRTLQVVSFIKCLNQTLEALDRNASPRLVLELLMLNLPGVGIAT